MSATGILNPHEPFARLEAIGRAATMASPMSSGMILAIPTALFPVIRRVVKGLQGTGE